MTPNFVGGHTFIERHNLSINFRLLMSPTSIKIILLTHEYMQIQQ